MRKAIIADATLWNSSVLRLNYTFCSAADEHLRWYASPFRTSSELQHHVAQATNYHEEEDTLCDPERHESLFRVCLPGTMPGVHLGRRMR